MTETTARLARDIRLVLGLLLVATLLVPSVVLGHAELDTISPSDKSSGPAPGEIVGTFVQGLDPAKSSFTVVDAAGSVVAKGGEVDDATPRTMTLTLSPLDAGTYTIRWTTVSTEDGELARGTTTFTVVAAPSAAPSVTPSESPAPSASTVASGLPSVAPTAAPSAPPSAPASSTSDVLIPIVAVLIVLVLLGLWLLRGRTRASR